MLHIGHIEFKRRWHILVREGLLKQTILLHYGKCRLETKSRDILNLHCFEFDHSFLNLLSLATLRKCSTKLLEYPVNNKLFPPIDYLSRQISESMTSNKLLKTLKTYFHSASYSSHKGTGFSAKATTVLVAYFASTVNQI